MAEGSAATDEHELIDAHAADLLVAGVYGVHIIADAGRHPPPAAEDAELHVALVDLLVAVHEVDGNAVLLVALHDHVPHQFPTPHSCRWNSSDSFRAVPACCTAWQWQTRVTRTAHGRRCLCSTHYSHMYVIYSGSPYIIAISR